MSWTARRPVPELPPAILDNFLSQEVGCVSTSNTTQSPSADPCGEETDSEYGDIDWCDVDELLSDKVVPESSNTLETEDAVDIDESVEVPSLAVQGSPDHGREDHQSAKRVPRLDPAERKRRAELRRQAAALHSVLTLCFIARLRLFSDTCDDSLLQAIALSLIPELTGKINKFPEQVKSFLLQRRGNQAPIERSTSNRIALLSALQGRCKLSTEQEVMLLVARCRAAAMPARIVMDVPLPAAKACASLLSGCELQHPYIWAEIFHETSGRWIPALSDENVLAGTSKRIWVVALGQDAQLCDVTQRYCARWSVTVAERGSLSTQWNTMIESSGNPVSVAGSTESADLNLLDKQHLARRSRQEPLPKTLAGFKRHAGYVLASQLQQNEVVHPSDAKPVGLFRGKDPIWRRANVTKLLTNAQWRRVGRQVREGERAHKIARSETLFAASLFGLWQTEELPSLEVSSEIDSTASIPGTNEYGNIEFLTKAARTNIVAHLPRGTVYINSEVARGAVAKIQPTVPFALAVLGFRHERGLSKPQPIYGGVVVWAKDEAIVRASIAERDAQLAKEADQQRAQRARQLFVGKKSWQRLNTAAVEVDLS